MKKNIIPVCVLMLLASLLCFLVVRESLLDKRTATLERLSNRQVRTENDESSSNIDEVSAEDRLTLTDTVILMEKKIDSGELVFRNIEGGADKTLIFDATTSIKSKRDMPLTSKELIIGGAYDITFTTYDSKISNISEAKAISVHKNIDNFTINERLKSIKIGNENLELSKNAVIFSNDEACELKDITSLDTITVYGKDNDIFSVVVNKGHGYIRVLNDSYFVGGWIEIGQDIIKVLTEDMLIPVPEGTYPVKVSNKGYVGHETLTIERDKETKFDLSKIEIEEVAIGHIKFDLVPEYALLYIDGLLTDFEDRVALEYGIHSIRVESAGYDTISTNIKVGSEFADIKIELEEESEPDKDDEDEEETTTSTEAPSSNNVNTTPPTTLTSLNSIISDNKKIYVEGPIGAEVYLDGTYIGVAPCNTNKIIGNHTVTLSRSGFVTKSYTINVSNDNNDLTLSFSELQVDF